MAIQGKVYRADKQVPVVDPFIIIGHHRDLYPKGKEDMSPIEKPNDWNVGQDFNSERGYNMYHGAHIPGFPSHPHRGFETISYARTGYIDHFDSLGNYGRYGLGDVQWVTSGQGIQHAEMFPLLNMEDTNPFEIVQIWFNLPAKYKMTDPIYKMIWHETIPVVPFGGLDPTHNNVKIIIGNYDKTIAHPINKNSWAMDPNNHVNIWEVNVQKGEQFTMPYLPDQIKTQIYVMTGALVIEGFDVVEKQLLIYNSDSEVVFTATEDTSFMVFSGREIGEPVAARGPFVMNSDAEILEAYRDFQLTEFGGWPWPDSAPTIDRDKGRFSYFDGGTKLELPPQK